MKTIALAVCITLNVLAMDLIFRTNFEDKQFPAAAINKKCLLDFPFALGAAWFFRHRASRLGPQTDMPAKDDRIPRG